MLKTRTLLGILVFAALLAPHLASRASGYGGYVIDNNPPTGVIDPGKDKQVDNTGGTPSGPTDPGGGGGGGGGNPSDSPEPASLLLGAIGLSALGLAKARRRGLDAAH